MDGKITITDVEPDRLSQLAHGLQAVEGVALHAPAALFAEQAGKDVSDRIQVRRDVQSPPLEIVPGIHDDCDVFGSDDLTQAIDELGASGAAGEYDDHAASVLLA